MFFEDWKKDFNRVVNYTDKRQYMYYIISFPIILLYTALFNMHVIHPWF